MDQYRRGELTFDVIDAGPGDGPADCARLPMPRAEPARTGHRQHAFQGKHERGTAKTFQKNAA